MQNESNVTLPAKTKWFQEAEEFYKQLDNKTAEELDEISKTSEFQKLKKAKQPPAGLVFYCLGVVKSSNNSIQNEMGVLTNKLKSFQSLANKPEDYYAQSKNPSLNKVFSIEAVFREHGYGANVRDPEGATGSLLLHAQCLTVHPETSKKLGVQPLEGIEYTTVANKMRSKLGCGANFLLSRARWLTRCMSTMMSA